jgi:hypothetical protein
MSPIASNRVKWSAASSATSRRSRTSQAIAERTMPTRQLSQLATVYPRSTSSSRNGPTGSWTAGCSAFRVFPPSGVSPDMEVR